MLLVVGLALVLGGFGLFMSPVAAVRSAGRLRFTGSPDHPTEAQVRSWRRAGLAIAVIGLIIVGLAVL